MHRFAGILSRTPVLRGRSLPLRTLPRLQVISRRNEATAVTGRPASQTIEQAALNVKEEVGNSARDIAKSIAGSPITAETTAPAGKDESFVGYRSVIKAITFISRLLGHYH